MPTPHAESARQPGSNPLIGSPGARLRERLQSGGTLPMIGVYDTFSASIAARRFEGIFVSGFSFAASHYGLPDIGFIAWTDMLAFVQRLRAVLIDHHIMVDIDDGYCDAELACHVVRQLESLGASGIVLEDQQRPRRCGHLEGKQLMDLDAYLEKLRGVLAARNELFVVARTDATDPDDAMHRALAFADAGADAILMEAVKDLSQLAALKRQIHQPLVFNQIAGGVSPDADLRQLQAAGVSLVHYSTPCLFAAQRAVEQAMSDLLESTGRLPTERIGLDECNAILMENLQGLKRP